jgi:hypothetical protein
MNAPTRNFADIIDQARRVPIEDEIARRGIKLRGNADRCGPRPACGALVPTATYECPECNATLRERRIEIHQAPLIEAKRLRIMNYDAALRWAGNSESRLRLVQQARGYKPGWIWHRVQEIKKAG